MKEKKWKVILASNSPRRKELLGFLTDEFDVMPSKSEEITNEKIPGEIVKDLSLQKAREAACQRNQENLVVIGSDTIVFCNNHILGKPKSREDAAAMLKMLQGNTHKVYTGVTLMIRQAGEWKTYTFEEHTGVTMYPMDQQEIEAYIETGEPMDKAGGYAVQGRGAVFIQKIEGEYNTVVGFPIARIYQELKKHHIYLTE